MHGRVGMLRWSCEPREAGRANIDIKILIGILRIDGDLSIEEVL